MLPLLCLSRQGKSRLRTLPSERPFSRCDSKRNGTNAFIPKMRLGINFLRRGRSTLADIQTQSPGHEGTTRKIGRVCGNELISLSTKGGQGLPKSVKRRPSFMPLASKCVSLTTAAKTITRIKDGSSTQVPPNAQSCGHHTKEGECSRRHSRPAHLDMAPMSD